MKKKILLTGIFIVVILSTLTIFVVALNNINKKNAEDYISDIEVEKEDNIIKYPIADKETAIKYGIALLKEYFPKSFLNDTMFNETFEVEEENGVWIVYNVFDRTGVTEDGKIWTAYGGDMYVEFRQDNGAVIVIGNGEVTIEPSKNDISQTQA